MLKMNIIFSLLILFEVALLVLFITNIQTNASRLYSTNENSPRHENIGYFVKESPRSHDNVDHIASEGLGDPNPGHHHSLLQQPRDVDHILRNVPSSAPSPRRNIPISSGMQISCSNSRML